MPNMFLLFSHRLTKEQIKEAEKIYKIDNFIYLTSELQKSWSNVPSEGEIKGDYTRKFEKFICSKGEKGDYVLIQGECGISYRMVNWCFKNGYIAIYSSTKRRCNSVKKEEDSVENNHIFNHVNFRYYL